MPSGYNWAYLLRHPWIIPDHYWLEIKYFWQRGRRGYSDRDLWNLNSYLCSFLPSALRRLAKEHCTYPSDMTPKQWEKKLKVMADGFDAAQKMIDGSPIRGLRAARRLDLLIDKGLAQFKNHFFDLWD